MSLAGKASPERTRNRTASFCGSSVRPRGDFSGCMVSSKSTALKKEKR